MTDRAQNPPKKGSETTEPEVDPSAMSEQGKLGTGSQSGGKQTGDSTVAEHGGVRHGPGKEPGTPR